MKFDELIKIDCAPLEFSWSQGGDASSYFRMLLTARYFRLFSEKMNIHLPELHMETYIPYGDISDRCCADYHMDMFGDIYEDNCALFDYVAEFCGFEIKYLYCSEEELYDIREGEVIWKILKKHFNKQLSESWKPFLDINKDFIINSFGYLEDASAVLVRNRTIGSYRAICNRYFNLIEKKLDKEKRVIDEKLEQIRYPIMYSNEYNDGYLNNDYYIYFDMGSNGCEYLDFTYLNYSWIVNGVVLRFLLEDFWIKLESLLHESDNIGAAS